MNTLMGINRKSVNLLLGVLILLGSSCEMPYFDRYPGERLKEVPISFQGDWVSYELNVEGGKWVYKDTTEFIISKEGWKSLDEDESALLSDSIILSKYKNYYFLSMLEEHGWQVMVIENRI